MNTVLNDFTLSNLQINMLTTNLNVNFNKMLETLIFQRSYEHKTYSPSVNNNLANNFQLSTNQQSVY